MGDPVAAVRADGADQRLRDFIGRHLPRLIHHDRPQAAPLHAHIHPHQPTDLIHAQGRHLASA